MQKSHRRPRVSLRPDAPADVPLPQIGSVPRQKKNPKNWVTRTNLCKSSRQLIKAAETSQTKLIPSQAPPLLLAPRVNTRGPKHRASPAPPAAAKTSPWRPARVDQSALEGGESCSLQGALARLQRPGFTQGFSHLAPAAAAAAAVCLHHFSTRRAAPTPIWCQAPALDPAQCWTPSSVGLCPSEPFQLCRGQNLSCLYARLSANVNSAPDLKIVLKIKMKLE